MDTRAEDSTDKHLDPEKSSLGLRDRGGFNDHEAYLNEKQIATMDESERDGESPISPGGTLVADPGTRRPKTIDDAATIGPGSPPEPRLRKICGIRRRNFWIIFGGALATIIAAAIIGGVGGGRRMQTAPPQTVPASTLPPPVASGPLS